MMGIVTLVVEAVKNIAALCGKLVDAADGKKYAEGVQQLNQNVDETYNRMRELILADETLTTEQKLQKLEKLAQSQEAARKNCEEAINGNKKRIAKVTTEIFAALTTCGLSYLPKIINDIKGNKQKTKLSTTDEPSTAIPETTETNA